MSFMNGTTVDHEAELAGIAGILNDQHARLVRAVARAERDGGWIGEGIHSVAHWLTIHLGVSPGRAKQIVTIARRLDDFPTLIAAFERGELSFDQVYEVAARAPAWADKMVTDFALVATVRQLRRMIRDEHFEGDPDGEPAPDSGPVHRPVSATWDEHGRLQLSGSLDAEAGALVDDALREARDALFRGGDTGVSTGEALAEIARRSLSGVTPERRERFRTCLHIHTDTGSAQLTNGVAVPPAIRDYLMCDGVVRPVWERDNVPFGVGRSQRTVPDRTRRIIEHRDQGCRVPGCGNRADEIHHIVPWSQGGLTETHNLLSLCHRHHKIHHLGELHISGNADIPGGVLFTDAQGRPLPAHPRPTPPTQGPPEPVARYEHPTGERLQTKWVGLGWVHPNAQLRRRERAHQCSP